jgi:hypothetical protein
MAGKSSLKHLLAFLLSGACLALLLVLTASAWDAEPESECCFTNPGYSGVCKVKPGEGETCKSILDFLNSPNSTGKSYCGGTNLRGGWKLVKCSPK